MSLLAEYPLWVSFLIGFHSYYASTTQLAYKGAKDNLLASRDLGD